MLVVQGESLVQEACTRHSLSLTAGAALGRALLGTLLITSFRQEGEKTQVTFKGDGPLGTVQVIATAGGAVKGKVGNPAADPPLRPDGKLNVGAAVGKGACFACCVCVCVQARSRRVCCGAWSLPGQTQMRPAWSAL